MSGTADNRWQQSNTHSQNRQPSSRDRSSGTLNPQQQRLRQETSQQQSLSIHPGNAWSTVDRSRSAAGQKPSGGRLTPSLTGTASGVAEEHHVSVKDFNTIEIKEFLRRSYQDAISGDLEKKSMWDSSSDSGSGRPSGPWVSKPSMMANGQDFWIQLRKQVNAREQGGGG